MSEREGVIQYQLHHTETALPKDMNLSALNAWRSVFYKLGLIGQREDRYEGLGFGNVSQRLAANDHRFLITGSQTGHLPILSRDHFAIVDYASPLDNVIQSYGPIPPSSEALTHASVYQNDSQAQAVIHVHSPEIWRQTFALQLPFIDEEIAYGTVAMAQAVEDYLKSGQLQTRPIFTMLGHEDGIVAFGHCLSSAASTLITQLAKAFEIELKSLDI